MRSFSISASLRRCAAFFGLALALVGICLGVEQNQSSMQGSESSNQGRTLSALRIQAKDENAQTRSEAATALGALGPTSIPVLTKLLRDKDEDVRNNAASALYRIGPAAVPTLTDSMRDQDKIVRKTAALALM